jgi:hypothetical protein
MSDKAIANPADDRTLVYWGAGISAVYLASWIGAIFFMWSEVIWLDLNEVGDFLAGVSAPLAFGWLVLGFFQQGKELRNQITELRLTVATGQEQAKSQELSATTSHTQVILEIQREAALQNRNAAFALLTQLNNMSQIRFVGGKRVDFAGRHNSEELAKLERRETSFETCQILIEKLAAFSGAENLPDLWTYFGEHRSLYGQFRNAAKKFSDGIEVWKKRLEELNAPEWEMKECDNSLEAIVWVKLRDFLAEVDKGMNHK